MKRNNRFVKDACVPSTRPDVDREEGFRITQEELEKYKQEYFKRGGKIEKIEGFGDSPYWT